MSIVNAADAAAGGSFSKLKFEKSGIYLSNSMSDDLGGEDAKSSGSSLSELLSNLWLHPATLSLSYFPSLLRFRIFISIFSRKSLPKWANVEITKEKEGNLYDFYFYCA